MAPPVPAEDWVRNARYLANHDGDTVTLELDAGFGWKMGEPNTFRLLGTNAPELGAAGGPEAQQFVAAWFAAGAGKWPFVVQTSRFPADKFGGRWDAQVWRVQDGASLAADLLASGHAKPWNGHGPKPV